MNADRLPSKSRAMQFGCLSYGNRWSDFFLIALRLSNKRITVVSEYEETPIVFLKGSTSPWPRPG